MSGKTVRTFRGAPLVVSHRFLVDAAYPEKFLEDSVRSAAAALRRGLEANLLRVVDPPMFHRHTDVMRDCEVFHVEHLAAGLLPEERLPTGWRAFFKAP